MQPITWDEYEYEAREHGADWYWALGILAAALTVAALMFQNVLLAILIVISAVSLGLIASRAPRLRRFELGDRGISLDDTLYPYSAFDAFGLTSGEPPKLIMRPHKLFTPHLTIPLPHEHLDPARSLLRRHLIEEALEEPLSARLMSWVGF
ncbi:MAG: hypothetical protein Q8R39_03540 [bacterium]|nr:hypothetical protein [bacterium]MDZ4284310.1 hypothetical protein [Patescibacteria group bacterium]